MQIDSEDIDLNYILVEFKNNLAIYKKKKETKENQNWSDYILVTEYEEGDYCYYEIAENDYYICYNDDDILVIELTEDYQDDMESNRIEVRTDY